LPAARAARNKRETAELFTHRSSISIIGQLYVRYRMTEEIDIRGSQLQKLNINLI